MNFRVFLAAACAAASAAFATPFSYGDILVSSSTAIYRYNQSGTLLQTFGTGGFGMAFDSSGNLYVANGSAVSKYDSSGNSLGTFVSGLPPGAYDIDFDEVGNAYVVGVVDQNFDFVRKYSSSGTLLLSTTLQEGQENWVFTGYAGSNRLLVTAGTAVTIYPVNTLNLTAGPTLPHAGGLPNGDVEGLPGGGFLVTGGDPILQYDSADNLVRSYNTPAPTHGTWIGLDKQTATTFWAVTDFGEVSEFNVGTSLPVTSFNTLGSHSIAVYTIPEPSTIALAVSGGCLLLIARLRKHPKKAA
jgi:hypothetical protein